MIDTRKQRPGGTKCKVLLRKTSIMGPGLWSKGPTEVPSPHTSFTTRLASEESIDFLHLVNEDTDGACLQSCRHSSRTAAPRRRRRAHVGTNTQNNNLIVNVTAKVRLLAPTFCFILMLSGKPRKLHTNTFYLSPGRADVGFIRPASDESTSHCTAKPTAGIKYTNILRSRKAGRLILLCGTGEHVGINQIMLLAAA